MQGQLHDGWLVGLLPGRLASLLGEFGEPREFGLLTDGTPHLANDNDRTAFFFHSSCFFSVSGWFPSSRSSFRFRLPLRRLGLARNLLAENLSPEENGTANRHGRPSLDLLEQERGNRYCAFSSCFSNLARLCVCVTFRQVRTFTSLVLTRYASSLRRLHLALFALGLLFFSSIRVVGVLCPLLLLHLPFLPLRGICSGFARCSRNSPVTVPVVYDDHSHSTSHRWK